MAKNVTIQRIVSVLLHRIKFIILATVVMGLLFFMYSRFVIAPMYSTSTMIYVQNYSSSQRESANDKSSTTKKADDDTAKKTTNEENQKIYPADISASANLAEICVTLFKNSDEMTALYDGCTVNVNVTDGTFFITITVDGTDAQKCANVANQLAEKAAEVYNSKFSYGQIGTLRQAKVPSAPYAPSNTKNMLIGAAIGLIASCLISILIELIDTTIKSEDDIQDIYGIPIFAEIPDFENQG
jgi:capsular polysaccharide biosynthesis protein|nr:Wzz/FepE/Etk N-terminal domain-containing protein [Ruminococcus bromii]